LSIAATDERSVNRDATWLLTFFPSRSREQVKRTQRIQKSFEECNVKIDSLAL
jgi:hypothetical protein